MKESILRKGIYTHRNIYTVNMKHSMKLHDHSWTSCNILYLKFFHSYINSNWCFACSLSRSLSFIAWRLNEQVCIEHIYFVLHVENFLNEFHHNERIDAQTKLYYVKLFFVNQHTALILCYAMLWNCALVYRIPIFSLHSMSSIITHVLTIFPISHWIFRTDKLTGSVITMYKKSGITQRYTPKKSVKIEKKKAFTFLWQSKIKSKIQ